MRLTLRAIVWLLPFAIYAASPFATAWTLKEAIKSGNVPVIDALVEWDSVRVTLRQSMTALALDRPMDFQVPPEASLAQSSNAPKAGLWQRVKGYFGTAAVERMINRYANAQGLPTLFSYGQAYKRYVQGVEKPPKTLANLPSRMREFWTRIRHVAFVPPGAFEIEMAEFGAQRGRDPKPAPGADRLGLEALVVVVRVEDARLEAPACPQLTPIDVLGRH